VKDIEEFIGLAQDVCANKAAMVAANGFSDAAKRRAQGADIELYRVVDTGDHPWRTGLSIPAVYECVGITEIGFAFECESQFEMEAEINVGDMELFDVDEKPLGKVKTLIHQKWNRGELDQKPGNHDSLEIVHNPVKVQDYQGVFHEMRVFGSIRVEKRIYFGHLRLTEVSGLHNVITGATITKRMVTENVGRHIEKTWTRINSVDQLAVRPVMTFSCADDYESESDGGEPQETEN